MNLEKKANSKLNGELENESENNVGAVNVSVVVNAVGSDNKFSFNQKYMNGTPVVEEPGNPGTEKVIVCHDGNDLEISPSALPAHLEHGDTLGSCQDEKTEEI